MKMPGSILRTLAARWLPPAGALASRMASALAGSGSRSQAQTAAPPDRPEIPTGSGTAEAAELAGQRPKELRLPADQLEQEIWKAWTASTAKNEFLARLSHELRTPMSGVLGMLDLLLDANPPAEQREQLEIAGHCGHSLLELLNDLLDLARVEEGVMVLEETPIDVRQVIAESVRARQAQALGKGVALSGDVDPAVPQWLAGDLRRLRRVLQTLVGNALRFTPAGGVRVTVRMAAAADACAGRAMALELEVADTGPGIPLERRRSIFENVQPVMAGASAPAGGNGLGLAFTKSLVELDGGSIMVDSVEGEGSTFRVVLPMAAAPEPPGAPGPSINTRGVVRPTPAPGTILVVEDNLINQKVVLTLLRKRGYAVDVANHGQEALDRMSRVPYGLILMDVQMPVLDGLAATRRIRENGVWAELPIIAMTAHAMNGDRERCLEAGMNEYLAKPVDHQQLLRLVEKYLSAGVPAAPAALAAPAKSDAPAENPAENPAESPAAGSQMLGLFLQVAPDRVKRMQGLALAGDLDELRRDAQKLRGAAQNISASGVAESADEVEAAAARRDLAGSRASLSRLDEALQALSSASDLAPRS